MDALKKFDLYRKVEKDLLSNPTLHGTILSIGGCIFLFILFVFELWGFLSPQVMSNVLIDSNSDAMLRINFNITVMDMPCEFAVVDVVDVLGTRNDNVTKNINKWQVDESGIRRNFEGRNHEQKAILTETHHDLEELHKNGVHATSIDDTNFDAWIGQHHFTFVNFFAPWCIWCQRLEPVWEAFAERIEQEQLPMSIVKVDCVENSQLCQSQRIQAFPTLRLFKDGKLQPPDFRSDRTVDAMLAFAKDRLSLEEQLKHLDPITKAENKEKILNIKDEHPGCMMTGFLLVNRVPGFFHLEARSNHHNLNPAMANLSHIVNSLSFGPQLSNQQIKKMKAIEKNLFEFASTMPMDGNVYLNPNLHQAYHHYIKVVSTQIDLEDKPDKSILAYQMVQSSQIMMYSEGDVPEARFSYDISPMSVHVTGKKKKLYKFITSICAMIGGTYTVVGLIKGFLDLIIKEKKLA